MRHVGAFERFVRSMKASRVAALGLVAGAALWIGSGYIFGEHPHSDAAIRPVEQAA